MLTETWEKNYLRNKDRIKTVVEKQQFYPHSAKAGDFHPCLCIGAGPSLDKNIGDIDHDLYEVIACDKTVPRLVDAGIIPDYIVAMNSVETDVRDWLRPALNQSKLVVPCVVWPETLDGWDDEHLNFVNSQTATKIHERIEEELSIPRIVVGSNAGTFSYITACYTYHNPIAYIGMDFSFLSKARVMKKYIVGYKDVGQGDWVGPCPDNVILSHRIDVPNKHPIYGQYNYIEMTDVNGDVRFLDLGWLDMADSFQLWVKFFKEWSGIITVNCTEGGINYSQYTEQMTLRQFNDAMRQKDEASGGRFGMFEASE
jgi:hypothetical protein